MSLSALLSRRAAPIVAAPASKRLISVQSLLHGSPEAKKDGDLDIIQHSRIVGRGKYLHGFETHLVKPDKTEEYKKAVERHYLGIKNDPRLQVKLTGNWETLVGEQDTFVHILEYENHSGFDNATKLLRSTPEHIEAYQAIMPFITSRTSQLNQEFGLFPTAPPRAQGGIFELRTYTLLPGTLLEWESTWRRGIEARRKFTSPVGAWFSQLGRLHQVHHMWQYPSLEARKELREQAWQTDGWAETVSKTSQLAKSMDSFILLPLPFSPLK
ncbi:Protein NipSnap 2 [Hypsizygus marmoreus]|uniref:Protein NipSnap 2 n=1 Tax=Hypsizygus marmoreus TaxID=39966 RepID=A0A369K7Y9_HYPMA|nr:Protein NipSnap 2 [Hypsizygus marmoreus]